MNQGQIFENSRQNKNNKIKNSSGNSTTIYLEYNLTIYFSPK